MKDRGWSPLIASGEFIDFGGKLIAYRNEYTTRRTSNSNIAPIISHFTLATSLGSIEVTPERMENMFSI